LNDCDADAINALGMIAANAAAAGSRVVRGLRRRLPRPAAWRRAVSNHGRRLRRRVAYRGWLAGLRRAGVHVLVGPNWSRQGGIRNHLAAIQKFSAQRVAMLPGDTVLALLKSPEAIAEFKAWFAATRYRGLRVAHSMVDPWFIRLCRGLRREGVRWVHTYHTLYFPELYKDGLAPWQIEINQALVEEAREAPVRLAVAKWLQAHLAQRHGISTVYVPNGVDVAACDQAVPERFSQETGLARFILYVHGGSSVKNPGDFVRLAQRLPGETFVMLGGGLTPDKLREFGVDKLPENLRVDGQGVHARVLDAVAACSVLVVTSKTEGMPTLVLEGMALRRPVVVPYVHGCAEAVGDERHGFIYRHDDLDDLVEKTLAALADRQRGQRARERVLAEYDWRVIAPKLDAIYRGEAAAADGGIA